MEMVDISEMLKSLVELYEFNQDTLSKYLGISANQIETIINGDVDCLPKENTVRSKILTKISFLYFGADESKDMKLNAFLEVLISYHNLSKSTIAKMAGVEVNDIDEILSNSFDKVKLETKYKVAATVMTLRFFLKECEPPI